MTTFIFAMTHPPELTALLETNPALWLAYVSREKYKQKAMTADWRGDASTAFYYYDMLERTDNFIWQMGYSTTKIGKPREIK